VVGPWATEFDQTWRRLAPSLGSKKLVVDLCGVIHMDSEATRVLAEIHQETGADFVADAPMTKYFADQARRRSETLSSKED
jgi:hypothetical protein